MQHTDFVHLHVHSEYSLLDGASRFTELVKEAKRLGMKALALTDHGVMYGTIPFYKACQAEGIKPIIGVEVYVTNKPLDEKVKKGEEHLYHLLLLAETYEGYQNLMKLSTKAHLEGFYYKPRVTKHWLREYHRGLICLSGCLAGELQQALLAGDVERARAVALEHRDIFGQDHYFIELQDHGLPEQKKLNPRLIRLAEELDIPLVVTNDVHYTRAEDAVAHDCLLCIGTGKKIQDDHRLKFPSPEFYLKSGEEMAQLFPHLPQAYENTLRIAERCQVEIPLGQEILPSYPVPQGMTAMGYLRQKCEEGLQERYENITDEIRKRLDYELEVIGQMGYADYFLIVWDFMRFAHEQGIITGPGRGSAAGSLVAYVLKITNVDPIKYNLLFERFLNPERVTMPDIDIDFSDRRRDEVLHYIVEKYGKDRVAQIITFGTLGARACVRDVGRVLGLPVPVVDRVAKCIPAGPGMTLDKAVASSAELRQMMEEDEQVRQLILMAKPLEGLARHTSIHAAGVVISEKPLTHYVPLQEGQDGIPLTQYPMEDLEALGLLKMDLLGLRNLTMLEEILRIINHGRREDERLTLDDIPFDDEATFRLLSEGDTAGVFQLESDGMRSVLKRLKPTTFEDIIAVLALYRPGPMDNIPLFIQAKHGKTKIEYPHPDLEPILKDTYGIIVYQEQIMQIASKMAGFSLGEADLLRRAVGKKKRDILERERDHFIKGCLARGYEQEVAEHVYDLIVRFADYGFNRSHSAAYAVIAYQLAYFKAHYPVAFLAALLSMNLSSPEKVADYLHQAAKRGIKVLPPSVLHSEEGVTVEQGHIRLGLSVIKNVGAAAVREIKQARQEGPFRNVLDFCQRVDLRICNRRVIEALTLAGALDELGMHRAQVLANLDEILDMAERAQGLKASDQLFFFADELPDDYTWHEVTPFSAHEQLKYEKEVLGFYLSGHPLDAYRDQVKRFGVIPLPELLETPQGKRVRTVGYVYRVKRITTKKGEAMAFVQLEDQGVEMDTVVFPQVFAKEPALYREDNLLLVEGKLEEREDRKQLIITRAVDLTKLEPQKQQDQLMKEDACQLFVKIAPETEEGGKLKALEALLRQHGGKTPVYLFYERQRKTIRLGESYHVQLSETLLDKLKTLLNDPEAVKVRRVSPPR
ncbi:DNA polymerase III, alpha subunit [Caldalkalibacillus thermarum TA2.A1]|uniref:DNA polymerase III subunit alpha n=1 Tax=Caldalkalibacillus thermarum (strain TA2.A1) TaxID=986075 RepID=F5L934_CALTT|nr:DNA polymerase III subunit alpha [Caldalkalibacillus thermarum]EGL82108.1 DNA polymerase III, alpha subunit [Caldalkalibacillus thermarum TA2.A1]